ncbi:S41 family peptidase [Granulicella arctica]|uniref:S41 family peptidase n=1 Tax=Granulicella arctica TaxID=940613 RepID=UPI0021E0C1DD|nr:S41 family peptidase [Granulicella arctica]
MEKLVRAYTVAVEGGPTTLLPLNRAGLMSYARDGHAIVYNQIFRNTELRKRYIGGQQQDLYTYVFQTRRLTRLTDWKGTDTSPMWYGHTVYFVSDRGAGFRANIWAYDLRTRVCRQLTHFAEYDVDWPSLGGSTITFQQGGHLFAIDLPSEHLHELKVDVPYDGERTQSRSVPVGRAARVKDAMGGVDYALSPLGDTLLLSARGDLFRVDAHAAGEDITQTPGIDEDHPSWSPDGGTIAYETDSSGSQQLAVRPAAGGPERLLTHFPTGYLYTPVWSPLGDSLAVADANHSLWWVSLNGVAPLRIMSDPFAEIRDAAFSPDGGWLAYSTQRPNQLRAIHLHELATGRDTVVSSPMESDRLPVFTPDGRLLVFVSQRNEQPFVSDRDDEALVSTLNSDGLYAVSLDRRSPSPLLGASGKTAVSDTPVRIDLDGLMARAIALPVTPASITSLQARCSELYYRVQPVQLIGGDLAGEVGALHVLDLVTMKSRVSIRDLDNFSLSSNGKRVAFRRNGAWRIASTAARQAQSDVSEVFDLSGLNVPVDPPREWAEMFENAWRLDRDVFFSKVMNGSNWQSVHDAYAKLIPQLGSQDDFLYLLAQMQGEIASSHTFIRRGIDTDLRRPSSTGLLGADYALDSASGRYRLDKIYRGDQTRPNLAGPLGVPGLDVKENDYLLAIGEHELRTPASPESLLSEATGEVTLTLAASPTGSRHTIKVQLLTDDTALRRQAWIEANRNAVDRLSNGRLGYIFLTSFEDEGSKDFVRQFYPQQNKEGLIFDVRWNLGGFTSQAVLNVLRRERAGLFVNREGAVSPLPSATAPPAMVTLINYGSASDGDQFPYFFHRFGLGKLVGERTWGGVQGINGPWRLMDGSFITIPKDALASLDGRWIIENEGVSPDLVVPSRPEEVINRSGRDAQLEAGVAAALIQIRRKRVHNIKAPAALPAYPPEGNVSGATFRR